MRRRRGGAGGERIYRTGVELAVEDPVLDDGVVDDAPEPVLEGPAAAPVAAAPQKAAQQAAEVLGQGEGRGQQDEGGE